MTLARDLALALDPALFMAAAGMEPDPWQAAFLRSMTARSLIMCSRQTGKSTTIAALAVHTARYRPRALVLIVAPSQRQSHELFRKATQFYQMAGPVDPEAESAQRLELENGSRIVALSGNAHTVRGYSAPDLVILDEAAWINDELFHGVTPMLAAGGRLIAMTTPFGQRGWFWRMWQEGGDLWHRVRVTADDSPRITPSFLAAERASKPEWRIRQEYFCEFVDTDEQLIGSGLIAAAMSRNVTPLLVQPLDW